MKTATLTTLFIVLLLFVNSLWAAEIEVFGPKQYLRTAGPPNFYKDSFRAAHKQARLVIKNGKRRGHKGAKNAVSSARITLNGKLIFGPKDFKKKVYLLEATVNLLENNTISAKIASRPGSYLTIKIIQDLGPPQVSISADPGTILLGDATTLTWNSTHADTVTIDNHIGTVAPVGSISVSPPSDTTYTITATGLSGTASESITILVNYPIPTIDVTANPETILAGESAILVWSSTNAEICIIEPAIGTMDPNGALEVSPTETTTYMLMATGPGGTATTAVTVNVKSSSIESSVSISVTPETVHQGETALLTWSSQDAEKVYIDKGIGLVPANGSISITPEHTTSYKISSIGPAMISSAQATVFVVGNPEPQPEGSFGARYNDLIPLDATLERYDPKRFSLITGLVKALDGSPISDVSITIHKNPAYGTVLTDNEGRFSIPVEGGGRRTITYKKQGLITCHRQVYVPWNDIAIAEIVQMIEEDSHFSTVTFDGNPDSILTHQSTEITDEFGTRSCSLVFGGDNKAFLVDEEGNDVLELTTISTRTSEYPNEDSMPAKLPPASAYTYCAELAVDGIQRVRFENPIITWVNNFLGFEVGEAVPSGYYDRDKAMWFPDEDGVVVKLLDGDEDGIVDSLDNDGDNQPDDLDGDGSMADEVRGLGDANRYKPGTTFWRVPVTHFSPRDFNWPYGPPEDAIPPNPIGVPDVDQQQSNEEDCKSFASSFIEDRSRIFHEDIPIPGTDLALHYASNRVKGHKTRITVPVSGNDLPLSLKRIIARIEISGRTLEKTMDPPMANMQLGFTWDGLDHLSRAVLGPVTAHIRLGFVYDIEYYSAGDSGRSFAQPGTDVTRIRARMELISWKRTKVRIDNRLEGKGTIADGWTLSSHHYFSPTAIHSLVKGDGSFIENNINTIRTIAGNGEEGYSGDGGIATGAALFNPQNVVLDAEGNLYIADTENNRIRKVDLDRTITTVAGDGKTIIVDDSEIATESSLYYPYGLAVDGDGSLYIADTYHNRICKVDPWGLISTVAGNLTMGYSGDGGLAEDSSLYYPLGVAIGPDRNLYIADTYNNRIRKVDPQGIISTVAGNGSRGYSGDGGPAVEAALNWPFDICIDHDGNLFIADFTNHRIRKVDPSGIISTVAGNGTGGFSGDGEKAIEAALYNPRDIAVDPSGNLYVADSYNNRIRKVDIHGVINTIAGNGSRTSNSDEQIATNAPIYYPHSVAVGPEGNLYLSDSGSQCIRMVSPPAVFLSHLSAGDYAFADKNGLGYIISGSGHHYMTIDLESGQALEHFGYDEEKRLITITDRFGNEISIDRDAEGLPTAIISPHGLTTHLAIDSSNHLTSITYPDGSIYAFEYTDDGLMLQKTEPEGNRFEHIFDSHGKLIEALDDEGGKWRFTRNVKENGDIQSEVLTGEGNLLSYRDRTESTGAFTSIISDSNGSKTIFNRSADGLAVNKSLPCGTLLETSYGVDPVYKYQMIKQVTETTPADLIKTRVMEKAYEDIDSDNIPDLITETIEMNDQTVIIEHDMVQSKKTVISPEGRTVTTLYNPDSLQTTSLIIPGLYENTYDYDTRGRLTSISTHSRQTHFSYDEQGFLASITDPENYTTFYSYDPLGRLIGMNRPDGSSLAFSYDMNGNRTVIINPSGVSHNFGYNLVNLNSVYAAPLSGSYRYYYDADRRLLQTTFPSGDQINYVYDGTRLTQVQTPEGNIDLSYLCSTKIGSISGGLNQVSFDYDGKLCTAETMSGTLNEAISYAYNNSFNITELSYAGGTQTFTYDRDGFLLGAGDFTISLHTENGLPQSITDAALRLNRYHNGYGEVENQEHIVNSQEIVLWDLLKDDNGRLIEKSESINGITKHISYTYDPVGRLQTVTIDGTLVEEYQYGSNGNRIYEINTLRGISGRMLAYSDEDHLLTAGGNIYEYDLDGFLTTKTDDKGTTYFDYGSQGSLLSVETPNGLVIEYIYDPFGRRIAKQVSGEIVEKYLWQGMTRLLAVYDGNDNLLMRFVYAIDRMPVAMEMDGDQFYLAFDQVGSLKMVADSNGNVVKSIDYDSFGNIINDSNPSLPVPFGFAGGLHDKDTGLVRFGYRDYDPETGRWTAKDPILFAGGDTDLYGYCLNDPVNWIDSDGKWVNIAVGAISGAIGGYITGGWKGAIIGTLVGSATGLVAPHASFAAGSIATSMLISGAANVIGQSAGSALFSDDSCSGLNINWGAAAGASVAGAFAPLWPHFAGTLFGGSLLAQGAMAGLGTGTIEVGGRALEELYETYGSPF